MRSRVLTDETTIPAKAPSLYDEDFAFGSRSRWRRCARAIVAALDLPNLIEELEGLTKRDARALGSQLKRVMAHLLKQRHQPERASRSWEELDRERP